MRPTLPQAAPGPHRPAGRIRGRAGSPRGLARRAHS
jgi:hypothetical protein